MHVSVNVTIDDNGTLVFADPAGARISQRLVDQAKRQHGLAIAGLIKAACKKVNRETEALGQVHLESPSPRGRPAYQPQPFSLPAPTTPGFVEKWRAVRDSHVAAGEARRKFLEQDILESHAAMETHLQATLQNVRWPCETHASFDVSPDGSSVTLEIDLPELDDLRACAASVPARGGRVSVREMAPTHKQKLYMTYVHGAGFRVIAETFAALPAVRQITLSAYTRRADKVRDEPLYAIRVGRDEWARIDFAALGALDVTAALLQFDLRREQDQTIRFFNSSPRDKRSRLASSRSMTLSS
jgi:hypothetical protein